MKLKTPNPQSQTFRSLRVVSNNAWYIDLTVRGGAAVVSRIEGDVTDMKGLSDAISAWAKARKLTINAITISY